LERGISWNAELAPRVSTLARQFNCGDCETTILDMSFSAPSCKQSLDNSSLAECRYRCVCGESFPITPEQSGSCPHCGRHYSPAALATNFAETMTLPAGGSSPPLSAAAADEANSLIGKSLDHFRIVSLLGQGGMGAVYQAVDESLQRYVALKVIRLGGNDPGQYDRLVQEARAQARVSHPHVVHIYYVGLKESSPFFAMELINGKTLAERLRQGPLAFEEVVQFALQIASALDRAAQFDIIHGDIKPSNILQVDPQTVKISDFGLSQRLSQTAGNHPLAGTPNYLSPEATRGAVADVRSDMYSLGVTLFELTFGRLPYLFSGTTLQEKLDAHVREQPEFPNPWPQEIPEVWQDVLARMLAKNPADRYPNYAALATDLQNVMPKTLVPAARLPRTLAWAFDFILLAVLQLGAFIPSLAVHLLPGANSPSFVAWTADLAGVVLSSIIIALGMYVQVFWRGTPGKQLFQLRIVNQHGLTPRRSILGLRLLLQFLPICAGTVTPLLTLILGSDWLELALLLIATAWVVVSGIVMLASPQTKSLHDRLLGTRVVVDTQ
jgi:uncharacterized RDD family membrane protein YckC